MTTPTTEELRALADKLDERCRDALMTEDVEQAVCYLRYAVEDIAAFARTLNPEASNG